MVNYMLMITAELENLLRLQPQGGFDNSDFNFILKLKCGNCGEPAENETWLRLSNTFRVQNIKGKNQHIQKRVPKIKGKIHHIQKCKLCSKEGTVTMIPGKGSPLTLRMSETGKYAPVMQFDCNGFEPIEFVFHDVWEAVSRAGTKYKNIDLSGDENSEVGEFAGYDAKGRYGVMITNVTTVFNVVN